MREEINIDNIADDLSRAYQDGYNAGYADALAEKDLRTVVLCKDCRHRDPEDYKCDCGGTERLAICT